MQDGFFVLILQQMQRLSVVIITYNEERNIGRCLESIAGLADEIVVLDSCSNDKTREICMHYPVTFIAEPFRGYIEQKNAALNYATNDWVLSLDADETLSPQLLQSITNLRSAGFTGAGYQMNRLTNYCGYWVRFGGWYPDRKTRLLDKKQAHWAGTNPHDRIQLPEGVQPSFIKGDILHYSYASISDHLSQIDHFSEIGATALHKRGVKSSLLKILYKPVARFTRNYILKQGFRDGLTGLLIAVNSAHEVFLKYTRLYFLQKKSFD